MAAIYAFSYAEVYDRNTRMLENYAANYQANRLPSGFVRPDNLRQRQFESPSPSAPFYAVLFDATGSVVSVESINANGYTVSDLVGFAHNALDKNERSGLEGSLMFAVEHTAGYTLVAFMDNTLVTESMGTLFRYTASSLGSPCSSCSSSWPVGLLDASYGPCSRPTKRSVASSRMRGMSSRRPSR